MRTAFSGAAPRAGLGTGSPVRYTPNNIPARAVNAEIQIPMQSVNKNPALVHNNHFTAPPAHMQDPIRVRNLGYVPSYDVPNSYQVQPNPGNRPIQVGRPATGMSPYDAGSPGQGLAIGLIGQMGYNAWLEQNYGDRIRSGEFETLRQRTGFDPAEWAQIPLESKQKLMADWRNPLIGDPADLFRKFAQENQGYQSPYGPQFPKSPYGPFDPRYGPFQPSGDADPLSPYAPWNNRNPETGQPYSPEVMGAAREHGVDPFFINPDTGKPYAGTPSPNDINPDTGRPYRDGALPFNPFPGAPGGALTPAGPDTELKELDTGFWTITAVQDSTRIDYSRSGQRSDVIEKYASGEKNIYGQSGCMGIRINGTPIISCFSVYPFSVSTSFRPDMAVVPRPGSSPTATPIGKDPSQPPATPSPTSPAIPGLPKSPASNPAAPSLPGKVSPGGANAPGAPAPAPGGSPAPAPAPAPGSNPASAPNPFSPNFLPNTPFIPSPGRNPGFMPSGSPGGRRNPAPFTQTPVNPNTVPKPGPNPNPNPNPTTSCSYKEDETQPTAVDYVTVTPIGRAKTPKVIQVHEKMSEATALQFKVLGEMRESLDKIEKNTKVSKVMHMISMATTIHNAILLSRDLAETLGNVTSMVFTAVGRMSGVVGESDFVNVNEILGKQFNEFMEEALGKETWNGTKESWQKASRIYQTGANIVNSVRDIADSTRDIGEFTAQNVSKIGNALRKFRVVGWDAYGTMDENARAKSKFFRNMDKAIEKGENLEQAASSLGGVAGNVLSIQDEVKDIKENRDAFKKGIAEWGKKDEAAQKKAEDASKVDEGLEEGDLK